MINALVAALEGFHHIFPGALIQEEIDRYCIEQCVFTCAYTMIVCLQDWRSKGDTDSEMIKNISNKMSNDVQRFELGHFITATCYNIHFEIGYWVMHQPVMVQNKQENYTDFPHKPLLQQNLQNGRLKREVSADTLMNGKVIMYVTQRNVYLKSCDASRPV